MGAVHNGGERDGAGAMATARRGSSELVLVVGATALGWAGFFVHNVADLPGHSVRSPETLYPTVLTLTLLVLWLIPATRTFGTWSLLAWTGLNLVGGALSVLPLPFLPFTPEQSLKHYAFHGLYALSQIPLLWLCISWLRARGVVDGEASP